MDVTPRIPPSTRTAPDVPRFRHLVIKVRPAGYELPQSYLHRLCQANHVDAAWLNVLIRRRYLASRSADELGLVLHELGGPSVNSWHRSFAAASVGMTKPRSTFARQKHHRTACLQCTHGEPITTYDHIRFAFCRKHGRWLSPGTGGTSQRPAALSASLLRRERDVCRLVTTGKITQTHQQVAWEAIRDYSYLSGNWTPALRAALRAPTFLREVDDRLALFPEFVRVLSETVTPEFSAVMREGSSTARRVYLHRAFSWLEGDRWIVCEALDLHFASER